MSTGWINQVGNWNPQFLRECRGHLKPRSVIATLGTSLLFQVLLILFQTTIHGDSVDIIAQNIFQTFTWTLPYFLFVVGGYYLVNDLAQEEKRGTFNFIRLSPRPAREILIGKLLGVPILPYLIVLSVVPLHIWSTLYASVSVTFLLSYYSLLIATALLCFSLALFVGITHQQRPKQTPASIAFAALALVLFAPGFMLWNTLVIWHQFTRVASILYIAEPLSPLYWLLINLTGNNLISHSFTLINLAIMIYFIWQLLERSFYQPRATLLSKRLSYGLTAYVNVLIWGFFQSSALEDPAIGGAGLVVLYFVNFGLILLLIATLTPHRQQLVDGLSYGQSGITARLWNDKSPAVTAIGVNILIACGLLVPWSLLLGWDDVPLVYIPLVTLSIALSWLTYSAIAQLIFVTRVRTPTMWAVGSLALWIFVPLILLFLFQRGEPPFPAWMTYRTFLGYPFHDYPQDGFFLATIIGVILQSGLVLGLLTMLRQRLDKLRKSVAR